MQDGIRGLPEACSPFSFELLPSAGYGLDEARGRLESSGTCSASDEHMSMISSAGTDSFSEVAADACGVFFLEEDLTPNASHKDV